MASLRTSPKTTRRARVGLFGLALGCAAGEALAAAAPGGAPRLFHWQPFLAPFHSVLLHFPIGFITVAGILEVYRAFRPAEELRRFTVLILGLGWLTGVISVVLGLLRADGGGYDVKAVELHRLYGLAVPVATAIALGLQWLAFRPAAARGWLWAYQLLLAVTLGLVTVAGHYGGNLTHGSKYLVENAPKFVRELLDESPSPTGSIESAATDQNQRDFLEKVQPVLKAKCYQCHGPEKQKGGYRLDQREVALKGGDSGEVAIKPGDPIASHLVRLILLPPEHDDVMPPQGKEPLTSEEMMTVLDWIRKGAVFPAP